MKKRKADGSPGPCLAAGRDRLGSLPDDLIGRILSLLPTRQAVLTSQLSRRWRRVWAHVTALNLSVRDCARRGRPPRFRALAREALLRFPTPGIPSVSVEINRSVYTADEWYRQAMERAVGSVRVASPRALNELELPPCARAEALAVRSPRTVLTLPDPAPDLPSFGRLAELNLSLVQLGGARPLGEFLASCCPRLRMLRLCSVRGPALRRLALRTDALEVLDVSNVDDLTSLDVAATNLRCLSVRSCFRSPTGGGGEVAVSAPRIEAVRWHRSYPEQLIFRSDLASARRIGGPLKLPALGRRDQFDAPYTLQLLHACSLAHHLDLELVMPDETTLLNWLGPAQGACEDLIRRVPQLPNVSALSLKIRWGFGGGIAPSLATLLSRTPSLTRLRVEASPYCFAVFEGDVPPPPPPRGWQRWTSGVRAGGGGVPLRLDGLREVAVVGLKGEDPEECRVLDVLLGSAARSLERVSLTFRDDAAASVADEIAADIPGRFPMAAGRWERCPPSVLAWVKREDENSQPRRAKKCRGE
ncbi:hypothetical protein C2845_PM03G03530 [Panicum miliaceum]|uniref:F-box domain-containing protein n=1 Tax=Panicum miliaceum TaxID=4540 RepID=A0A3L6T9X2_PANMI|nr:hypothetical protein C2845_PM03G03530 [Panicum miliaceum]